MFTGLIDLHTHGAGEYDTRTDRPEDILKIAALHAKAGTSKILPTIYSDTIRRMRAQMEAVRRAMEMQRGRSLLEKKRMRSRSAVRRRGSGILGVHLEGPFLNPLRAGAQERRFFRKPSLTSLRQLVAGYEDIIRIITVAPELPGALGVIQRCAALGIRVNMGHSDATCEQALRGKRAGATGVSHLFNAMRPFHHREPGLAGFGLVDEDVYIEIIADGVHLDKDTLRLILRSKPPERVLLVSDSIKGAGRRGRPVYTERGALAGSSLMLSAAVENLVRAGISRRRALGFASLNPLQYLGTGGMKRVAS